MANFEVVEMFESINGEGMRAGEIAFFVRLKGCNLNCNYCDTKWANQKDTVYSMMTEEEIYKKIEESKICNVTLTGGEPLAREHIEELLGRLTVNKKLRIEIETNGSINIKKYKNIGDNIVFTLDYKMPGSGMEKFMDVSNYELLSKNDTVKMVISSKEDLDKAREIIEKYGLKEKCHVILSPVFGRIDAKDIVEYLIENKMNDIRVQLQLHKYIWDPEMRGV